MPADWSTGVLADLCSAVDYGFTASASSNPDAGPKFLRITDIRQDRLHWGDVPHVEISPDKLPRYVLGYGDIVVARTGAFTGANAYVVPPVTTVFASYLVRLRAGPRLCSRFAYYFMQSQVYRDHVAGVVGGSAQPNASARALTQVEMPLPPLDEQHRIAAVLGALDDKIELNRRMNETLEQAAQAIFRASFIDFSDHNDLVDSELGPKPRTWVISSIADQYPHWKTGIVKTGPFGSKLHASDYSDDGVPLVLVKHVQHGHIAHCGTPRVGYRKLPEVMEYRLRPEDIVVTRVGRVGDSARVERYQEGWLFSGQTLRVRLPLGGPVRPLWLYYWYRSPPFLEAIDAHSVGSTRASLNTEILGRMRFVLPPASKQLHFESSVAHIWERMSASRRESETLGAIRDALLPKLISGELRVPDAERVVGEVV